MTDLTLEDFRELFSERLVHVLSGEKKKLFGEQELHVKKREDNSLRSSLLACSLANVRKDGT
jgi:hypothetical protein